MSMVFNCLLGLNDIFNSTKYYQNRPTVYHSNTIQYHAIPFNTVQYHSVPFNTIEDIKVKFVGINSTLNGKKTNEWYTIENLKYRSVPLRNAMVSLLIQF